MADLILQLSHNVREQTGLNQVALSGGVFQNVTLLQKPSPDSTPPTLTYSPTSLCHQMMADWL
ncbi:MAG: hypothetical protein M5U34_45915 [Chloroflexi bacterium]|nr:hypothetical protein [Chloroflexota bacterium]